MYVAFLFRCTVEEIPMISVKRIGFRWVTADNRRLWVFKHLERLGKCETVPVSRTYSIPDRKMTSTNGGVSVRVREEIPGGCWYLKPNAPSSRLLSQPTVAASRSIDYPMHQELTNSFLNTVPATGNQSLLMSDRHPSPSLPKTLQSTSVTRTTRPTVSTVPLVKPNMFRGYNDTHSYSTDCSHQEVTSLMKEKFKSKLFLVCAIDFGTTYSGWAYSFKDDYEKDQTRAYIRQWLSGSDSLCTEKTPTVALISPDGRTLVAFGYEAENEYKRLMETNKHKQYYLFRRFKMTLYKKLGEGITRNIKLKDELGRQLPAVDVFSLSIKYLADDLKEKVRQKADELVDDRRIDWVLTVPAIWTDAAKQFMREAATKAGLSSDRLTLALEPEAASLYCRHLTSDNIIGEVGIRRPKPGSKYLIFDAGGGTVDITLHQVGTSDTLREVKPACGAHCGGIMVDKTFENLMMGLVGEHVYTHFRITEQGEFMDFQREFEFKKRRAGGSSNDRINVRLPTALAEIYLDLTGNELKDAIATSNLSKYITLVRDSLRFDACLFACLFDESVTNALFEVKNILQNEDLRYIHAIYMVGGYSQSPVMQKRMEKAYPTLNVVIPHDAATCVLKGALIYGHNPTTISERVLKYSYGVRARQTFDPNIHPLSKQIITDDGIYCEYVFDTHANIGQTVHIGTMQERQTYTATIIHQQSMSFTLYASDKESPRFVDEPGCRKIGEARLVFEDPHAMTYPEATVCLTFSDTEIVVEAVEVATGQKITSNMNFLG